MNLPSPEQRGSYTYEPDPGEIMEVLLPLYLNVQIYHAMLEVGASEHAARMTAMDNATNACKDIITGLDPACTTRLVRLRSRAN